MSRSPKLSGRLVIGSRVVDGTVTFGDRIEAVEPATGVPARYILPGFIDTHVHGGGGGDVIDGVDGIDMLARFHARHGTTTLLPTTITRPWPEVMAMLQWIALARARGVQGGADILGAHLEGPFISPERLGAQPPFAIDPDIRLVSEAIETGVVRVVTIAPELRGMAAAIEAFVKAGARISIGHTVASYEECVRAISSVRDLGGSVAATHLFNAMSPLTSRDPGAVGAILTSPAAFAEIILDAHHVHPANLLLTTRMLGSRIMLVTDAIRAAGMGDGVTTLGGQTVAVEGGVARLPGGGLAGSVLTQDASLRNAVEMGIEIGSAVEMLSTAPARYLGLTDRGILAPNKRADLVLLSEGFEIENVWVNGVEIPLDGT